MINFKKIEEFTNNFNDFIPKIIQDITKNIDMKIQKIINHQINRMNLINREEFDIQSQILSQAQEELTKLTIKLNQLEKKLNYNTNTKNNNN